ncbi:hypothetical protein [Gulbenkiania mobilis]|uniref:hypothetical protein n=1 Tax=Gulbenkiania mobilis TaxID=397457 RepID=UPI001043FD2D
MKRRPLDVVAPAPAHAAPFYTVQRDSPRIRLGEGEAVWVLTDPAFPCLCRPMGLRRACSGWP